jgi:hypothetical protein
VHTDISTTVTLRLWSNADGEPGGIFSVKTSVWSNADRSGSYISEKTDGGNSTHDTERSIWKAQVHASAEKMGRTTVGVY